MNEETAFAKNVQSWTRLIVDGGETDFRTLVDRLPGVDPGQVVAALSALDISWPNPRYRELIQQARTAPKLVVASDWAPFVPHPLDFDWRFTRNTIEELSRTVLAIARPERIALLGTPSLVPALEIETPGSSLRLFERNPLWIHPLSSAGHSNLEVIESDLSLLQVPSRLLGWADVVVADPPWYLAAQLAYLWAAKQLLRPGGFLLASIPPIGTRPAILLQREALNAQTESWGFSSLSIRPAALRYRTPPFELNALRAAEILVDLAEWRSGDLAVYQRTSTVALNRPRIAASMGVAWAEVCINGIRIKIRQGRKSAHSDSLSPELVSLVDGDILPSVSARHPLRADVDVWTSGNRVFKCKESVAFIELCRNLRDNRLINLAEPRGAPMDKRIDSLLKPAERRLASLVSLEFDEYLRGP
jgi:hypothetical protein